MKVPLLLATALLTLALAGCSGGSDGPVTPTTDAEGRYVIQMAASGNRFLPQDAEVPVGATVVWQNEGATPHNVIADDGSFSSGSDLVNEGEEFEHEFAAAGTVAYRCHLHAGMAGTLTVT